MDISSLRRAFEQAYRASQGDPLVNPVRKIASDLFLQLESGNVLLADLAAVVRAIDVSAFEARAARFHKKRSSDGGEPTFAEAQEAFATFKRRVERCSVGIVFTAHPTFALGRKKRALLAAYPGAGDDAAIAAWRKNVEKAQGAPDDPISLSYEHEEAICAIGHAQSALRAFNESILIEAAQRFPDDWRSLCPQPISLATWVGYDLDGRTDIHWGETVRIRLSEKASQLRRYAALAEDVLRFGPDAAVTGLRDEMAAAANLTKAQADRFAQDLDDPDIVIDASNFLTADSSAQITSLTPHIATLQGLALNEKNAEKARALILLGAEMRSCGLGLARIHLRVNAAQVRSALKADFGLDPDSGFQWRSALEIASGKARAADRRSINFGSVFLERMTARRQFMLCAQILKHIDSDTPVRFLIAECEAPATVMGAVYLARLYGVDDKLDISPLFETPEALEGGGRFLERLLAEPEYQDYVRRRGRMSIQIGYSDSGRFMGQCAAGLAAERLQVLFARALEAANLPDVEALVFNTHGESMGRGAHPSGFPERADHVMTPWVRSRFRKSGIHLNGEFSFQGGEGYLHFQTPELAAATVTALWRSAGEAPDIDLADRYYTDINFSWDFYRGLKSWQEDLYGREDYRAVLFSFAKNTLFKTGSRKVSRPQSAGAPPEIRTIRAIPNNAILQQLAAPVNVAGGVGVAANADVERFIDHVRGSLRMRDLLGMAYRARSLTSITILRAYAGIYATSFWSALAGASAVPEEADAYETVLQSLQQSGVSASFDTLADFLANDLRKMDAAGTILANNIAGGVASALNIDLGLIHAVRQALIAHAAALVAKAPAFSQRHDIDRNDLIVMALDLRLDETADLLAKIFPIETAAAAIMAGLTEQTDSLGAHGGYPEIHDSIIEPLRRVQLMLTEISKAIANFYDAYG